MSTLTSFRRKGRRQETKVKGFKATPEPPERTYWNGEPTPARRVVVKVGAAKKQTYWYAKLEGTLRKAVQVFPSRPGEVLENPDNLGTSDSFFLDDENGAGWLKVTKGMGSPQWGHSSLPEDCEVVEIRDA